MNDQASSPSDNAPVDGPTDHRVAVRRSVTWKARVMIAQGTVFEAKTADISSSGVGLVGHHPLPPQSVVQLALQVPHLTIPGNFTVITCKVRVAFQVMRGSEYRIGAQWVDISDANRSLLVMWTDRLAGKPVGA